MRTSYFMACGPGAPAGLLVSNGRCFPCRKRWLVLGQRSALLARWQRQWLRPRKLDSNRHADPLTKLDANAVGVRRAIGCESRHAETPVLRESAGTVPRWFESP